MLTFIVIYKKFSPNSVFKNFHKVYLLIINYKVQGYTTEINVVVILLVFTFKERAVQDFYVQGHIIQHKSNSMCHYKVQEFIL